MTSTLRPTRRPDPCAPGISGEVSLTLVRSSYSSIVALRRRRGVYEVIMKDAGTSPSGIGSESECARVAVASLFELGMNK